MEQRSDKQGMRDSVVLAVVILVTLFGFLVIGVSPTGYSIGQGDVFVPYLWTNALILLAVTMLVVLLVRKLRGFRMKLNPVPPVAHYIQREQEKGLSKHEIEEKLLKAGWEQKEFKRYL